MNMTQRSELCLLQMQALHENVVAYEPNNATFMNAGYATPKNGQANKTAIMRQIVALRQSLLALAEEVGA